MADFVCKQGDTTPVFTATIVDNSGNVVNLTGATVTFVSRSLQAANTTTNAAATIVAPTAGTVSYTPTAYDTAVAGRYMVEWHYTLAGGATGTYPVDGYQELTVEENLTTPGGQYLVSLNEVKDHLRIANSDHSHDYRLREMIYSAGPIVEGITGPILQRKYENETYDGGVWFISLMHRPVLSVESVVEYRGPIAYNLTQVPTPDLGTIYSYMFEPPGRIVRRTVGGGSTPFPPGADAVFVSYTAGMQTVPANVVEATKELIRVNFQRTDVGGRPAFNGGVSYGGEDDVPTAPAMGFLVPGRVREMLEPNRRHPSVG